MASVIDKREISTNGAKSGGEMQGIKHLPKTLPAKQRIKDTLRKGWSRVVRKTDDGNFTVSKPVAGIFISAFLGIVITGTYGLLAQRDEIVRLRTLQEIQDRTNADMLSKIDQAGNKAMIADRNAARIEGKFDQFALTFSIKNADKANIKLQPE